jgi:hypothetical protein
MGATMKVVPRRITPCTTSVIETAQMPPRNVYVRIIIPVTIVIVTRSMFITGDRSLDVAASCTPALSVKLIEMTQLRNCCVEILYRVYVYSTGEIERVRRQRLAVRNDPRKYATEPSENQTSMKVPVLYVNPAAPENVHALKFAI